MVEVHLLRAPRAALAASLICASLLCACIQASPALAARGFSTGLYEPDYTSPDAATQTSAFDGSVEARAGYTLIYVDWSGVAPPTEPVGFVPTNPADPSYHWSAIDAAVVDA